MSYIATFQTTKQLLSNQETSNFANLASMTSNEGNDYQKLAVITKLLVESRKGL